MKRIVDGVTYNTDTATRLARSVWEDTPGEEVTGILYQTRGGAFFVHTYAEKEVWIERIGGTEKREVSQFEPLSAKDAHEWIMTGEVEVFSNPFEDPPEATAEPEPGATIYIRVPMALKKSVDEAARAASVSSNVWAMRCLERCVATQKAEPAPQKEKVETGKVHKIVRRY
jgi:predicted HicB family RNase H-like nuclease